MRELKTTLRGYSLIELVIALSAMAIVGVSVSAFISFSISMQGKIRAKQAVHDLKREIVTTLSDRIAWQKTLEHVSNTTAFSCLRAGTCTSTSGGAFNIYTASNYKVYDANSSAGLSRDGAICTTFSSSTPDPACGLRYSLVWNAICESSSSCENPRVRVRGTLVDPIQQASAWATSAMDFTIYLTYTPGCTETDNGLIQGNNTNKAPGPTTLTAGFLAPQTAGNTNIVTVIWDAGTGSVTNISDSRGNPYTLALGPTQGNGYTMYTYYATEIAGGTNTVTVQTSGTSAVYATIYVSEYWGLASTDILDGTPVGATGAGLTATSPSLTTVSSCTVLYSPQYVENDVTTISASWVPVDSSNFDMVAEKVVKSAGSYTSSATQNISGNWITQLLGFKRVETRPEPTVALRQAMTYNAPATWSTTMTLSVAQTAGNTNIVAVTSFSTTASITGVSDTGGNSYVLVGSTINAANNIRQYIYYAKNISATANNQVTINASTSVAVLGASVMEFSGLSTTSPLDTTVGAFGTSSSPNSGAVTTNFSNELILGFLSSNSFSTVTVQTGAGFMPLGHTTSHYKMVPEYRIVSAPGSYNANASLSSSADWVMRIVGFH